MNLSHEFTIHANGAESWCMTSTRSRRTRWRIRASSAGPRTSPTAARSRPSGQRSSAPAVQPGRSSGTGGRGARVKAGEERRRGGARGRALAPDRPRDLPPEPDLEPDPARVRGRHVGEGRRARPERAQEKRGEGGEKEKMGERVGGGGGRRG